MRQFLDKKIMSGVVGITVVVVLICAAWVSQVVATKLHTTDVEIGDVHITARVADNDASRMQGLSNVGKLSPNHGMLFIFGDQGGHPMWMKDMLFSIDIIWLDSSKKVVHIEKNVSPQTYPENFSSPTDSQYVLEVPSGFSDANHIREGTLATFAR